MNTSMMVSGLRFPEGPAFDQAQNLWCVEQKGGGLVCVKQDHVKKITVGGCPNGIAISPDQQVWFCDSGQNSIRIYSPLSGTTTTVVDSFAGKPLNMPNDLAFDTRGQLVFTCPGPTLDSNEGYICVYTSKHELYKIAGSLYYPNGLAFTADGRQLLVAETGKKQLWIGDWDAETAQWVNRRVFAETGGAVGPDGMALDEDGNVYVAIYGSGLVRVFGADGQHTSDILTPGMNPTNCAFDPSGRLGLVITEAEMGTLVRAAGGKKGIL